MNKIEKVLTVIMFGLFVFIYGIWYVRNSNAVKSCMENLPACEDAYYANK